MLRVTLRNLLARKVRLVLSAFAIVLGVAFLSGSLIFTDTMGKSFDNIVSGSVSDVSVRLTGLDLGGGFTDAVNIDSRQIPASLVPTLAAAPGVARADGSVDGQGLFVVKKNGKLLGGTGAPTLAFNYSDAPNANGDRSVLIAQGREPSGPGEVAIDEKSATSAGYAIGDTVDMITAGAQPKVEAKLVGYAEFAGGGLAGASLVFFDTSTAQDIFLDGADAFTSIGLTAKPGFSQQQVVDAIEPLLPQDTEAITGKKAAAEIKSIVDTALGFLNTFLLVFAAIALVVGTFLIINTFSILVAQRSRELALLRALGASRRQVTRSVLVEAAVVGLLGSTLGLGLGFGLAAGLRALFANFGLDLTGSPLVFQTSTAVFAYVVGVLVTMFAAYLPARRASRIAPVAAMRDDIALPEGSIRRRLAIGVGLAILGAVLMTTGLMGSGSSGATQVGLGIFAILIAIALMSPVLAVPVLVLMGSVYVRLFGTVGRLATQNSLRNPRRTAATASALMIGLALVTTMSVLGASINKSIDVGVKKEFTSDYLVSNAIGQPFSPTIAGDIKAVDGVRTVAATQLVSAEIDGDRINISAGDSRALGQIFDIDYLTGGPALQDGQLALVQDKADSLGVAVGDTVTLRFAAGTVPLTVSGTYTSTYVVASAITPFSTVAAGKVQRADSTIAVNADDGVDQVALGKRLEAATLAFPTVTVQNQEEFAQAQRSQVDQLLYLIYALLGLAIIIAVLGIVNTLALSVIERTREVGLLRAVGLGRGQLRRMVRLEAIAIAVLGALLGIAAGLLFGIVLQQAVADQGITDLAIPWTRLAVFVIVAGLVGVLAAVLPARRAAKLNVLRAITTE
ncbi:ABC transporter permease [Aeromicrobium sp. A1-2]|uniref:ABC transporter permease n=1 Tax=Aeromicrobium sp. A1-2 TaxID=2107713 RepID=UPI000E53AC0A|nr:FtsX-like permease family protein [Aeromicrobium sp. A1-2]AXT86472.1 ABC transporter permease [Aeromicrobium sp. A1-2]